MQELESRIQRLEYAIFGVGGDSGILSEVKESKAILLEVNNRLSNMPTKEDLKDYTRRSEFNPVRTIVFGAVGLILTAVIGALIASVVVEPKAKADPVAIERPMSAIKPEEPIIFKERKDGP